MSGRLRQAKSRCPVCQSPTVVAYTPFCSKRCADIDLHRWLNESYSIPASNEENDQEEASDWDD
ncbi:MAG: DNA gyrase inhibitor YacG [Pseudomonadota bacterium]